MNISIRQENKNDHWAVENMTREAFWDLYKPGCDEHFIVHKLRKVSAFVPELDFVACNGQDIAGNIIYSKAKIINAENLEFEVLCMGPLTVLPSLQRKGIGILLMTHSIEAAKVLGYKAIIIFGDPAYYRRFGFKNAKEYDIQTAEGTNLDAFMVLELSPNALRGVSGKFYYDSAFDIDQKELQAFERQFSPKEKHILPTQFH